MESLTVNPFENISKDYTLRKRPPRLYGFAMATASPKGYGAFLGMCRRWGAFVNVGTNFKKIEQVNDFYDEDDYYSYGSTGPGFFENKGDASYLSVTGGVMARCCKFLYLYAGAGWAEFSQSYYKMHEWKDEDQIPLCGKQGATLDFGAIFKWKALLVSGGV